MRYIYILFSLLLEPPKEKDGCIIHYVLLSWCAVSYIERRVIGMWNITIGDHYSPSITQISINSPMHPLHNSKQTLCKCAKPTQTDSMFLYLQNRPCISLSSGLIFV
jgi:hypothetical protein